MADYIFDAETPNQQAFDGGWHTLGSLAGVEGTPNLIGGRAWFPNPVPGNFLWLVYDTDDQSIVAQVDLNVAVPDPVLADWNEFTSAAFEAPGDVSLESGEGRYAPVVATNGDFVYLDAGVSYPIGDGVVIAAAGFFHNGGTGPVFPTDATSAAVFFADMLVEAEVAEPNEGTAALTVGYTLAAAGARPGQGTAAFSWTVALTAAGGDGAAPGAHVASGSSSQLTAAGTSSVLTPSGSGAMLTASGNP